MNRLTAFCQSLRTPDPFFNISYALMLPMMLLLPYTTFFMWPIGIALTALWIGQWNWHEKWENFKANDGIPYGFFLLCICLVPLLGFINSENMPIAWRTLECHLWFFITPLIFLTSSTKLWSQRHVNTLIILFSASEIGMLLFFAARGIHMTAATGDISYMFDSMFCKPYHHAYIALYATFVYTLVFYYLSTHSHNISTLGKALLLLTEVFLAACIFCVYSRAGILTFLIIHLVMCGYAVYRNPSRWKFFFGILILVFALFATLIAKSPNNRFTQTAITLHQRDNDNRTPDARLIIWQAAWDGAIENMPWGVGTGDGHEVIVEKYHENGYWEQSNHPYNAHNQLLSALLTNGIPGLLLTTLYLITPLCTGIKHRDILLLALFLLLFFNCMVECMFDRRAGVDFFAIMIPLFILRANLLKETPKQ